MNVVDGVIDLDSFEENQYKCCKLCGLEFDVDSLYDGVCDSCLDKSEKGID